jgi:Ca-activated chloride channel family protein
MKANLRIDHQLLAVETEHEVHCMLELAVPDAPGDARPPLHLALVVDRSGSMAGEKLDVARRCATHLAARLKPTDQLALVTYDDEVQLRQSLAPVDPAQLKAAVDAIDPGGTTNLSGGWLKGIEELDRAPKDGTKRVLLLTDGMANVGITDPKQLTQIAAGTKQRVSTTTIGFGADFDENLLAAIADASNGNAYFAETPDAAPGIFAEEFEGLSTLVAQNLSVEIRPGSAVEVVAILNDYPTVATGTGLQAQIGDAYGAEERRVVFSLRVPSVPALGPAKVADVVLRYVDVGESVEVHEVTLPVVVNLVSADDAAKGELDAEVTEEVWLLQGAHARRRAMEALDRGDHDEAHRLLSEAATHLRGHSPGAGRAEELWAEASALETRAAELAVDEPDVWRKRLHDEHRRLSRRRHR